MPPLNFRGAHCTQGLNIHSPTCEYNYKWVSGNTGHLQEQVTRYKIRHAWAQKCGNLIIIHDGFGNAIMQLAASHEWVCTVVATGPLHELVTICCLGVTPGTLKYWGVTWDRLVYCPWGLAVLALTSSFKHWGVLSRARQGQKQDTSTSSMSPRSSTHSPSTLVLNRIGDDRGRVWEGDEDSSQ